jgi:hypothetical protein
MTVARSISRTLRRSRSSWFLRPPVTEQIGGDDRMVSAQFVEHRLPGVRAVADPVDEEEGRSLAEAHERPPVPMDRAEPRGMVAFPSQTWAEANDSGVDRRCARLLRWTRHPVRPIKHGVREMKCTRE